MNCHILWQSICLLYVFIELRVVTGCKHLKGTFFFFLGSIGGWMIVLAVECELNNACVATSTSVIWQLISWIEFGVLLLIISIAIIIGLVVADYCKHEFLQFAMTENTREMLPKWLTKPQQQEDVFYMVYMTSAVMTWITTCIVVYVWDFPKSFCAILVYLVFTGSWYTIASVFNMLK